MSWKDRISNIEFTIKTGDGKEFKPLWKGGEKTTDFNFSKFDFINVSGSLINKRKPLGASIPLLFWFQGDDNIDQASDFENSAKDNRLVTVTHPFYGTLKGQIVKIHLNDNSYGITEVAVDFWESITEDYPNADISLVDEVRDRAISLDSLTASTFASTTVPLASDISLMKELNLTVASELAPDLSQFADYYNTVNKAISSANNFIENTQDSISDAQKVLSTGFNFKDTVANRLANYVNAYEEIKGKVSKALLEVLGVTVITSVCNCVVNPEEGDYSTRSEIEEVNEIVNSLYADLTETLDEQTVDIHNVDDAWVPNVNVQSSLMDLVSLTTNQLYVISFQAKQERSIELEKNSNLILLTHRFMGLSSDENIDVFRKINNIYNDELLQIEKGRIIKWFV